MGRGLASVLLLVTGIPLTYMLFCTISPNDQDTIQELPSQRAGNRLESIKRAEQFSRVLKEAATPK